jgi:arsenite/tail-anchored protein-transporting ATPase
MSADAPSFLSDDGLELIFFGGKGGVGKTTCACAAALHFAKTAPDGEFLLVSTDPAHSLADSLADLAIPPNLTVTELDAKKCIEDFKAGHGGAMRLIASRGTFLDNTDIDGLLNLSMPGMDELMAALQICEWNKERRFSRIVVDTAPTGHTLKLLAMPEMLRKWLDALDSLMAKHRYMQAMFGKSKASRDEADEFLVDLTESVDGLEALLSDEKRCRFVPVMLAETMSMNETRMLLKELKHAELSFSDIIINRIVPDNACPVCRDVRLSQSRILKSIRASREFSANALWTLPLFEDEVRGKSGLETLWGNAQGLSTRSISRKTVAAQVATPESAMPLVENAKLASPVDKSLILFAGKGGVGKTTLSCATALRLAKDLPGEEILLFSTDPAHALSSCLDVKIGREPVVICPGLTVLQIDAGREFEALRKLYGEELRGMLHSMLPDMDMSFDQEAMEKLMDLAPPGLDEVMALMRVMELQNENRYRAMVLDTAPTGHLIRLLEMPELIDQWLKLFFGFFLKYKAIFRLPKITQRLVDMSKDLKGLRAMLADPARASLFGVTILTDMAFDETRDLADACKRMNIDMPALFLNLATPDGECRFCAALRRREAIVRQKYAETFCGMIQTQIFRGLDLRGLHNLSTLGHSLYAKYAGQCNKAR